jgi:hypothetical protein
VKHQYGLIQRLGFQRQEQLPAIEENGENDIMNSNFVYEQVDFSI